MKETTTIRMRELAEVFAPGQGEIMRANMARLAVLYEDLRIELLALVAASIPILDVTDPRYRVNYFLRRCIATLVEFAETIRLLDECAEFQDFKDQLCADLRNYWDEGHKYFKSQESFFKRIRNDIGGHFGLPAALFAVKNLSADAVGKIELGSVRNPTLNLHFAGELVATAMLRQLRQGTDNDEKFTILINEARLAFRHATRCAHFVACGYLWDRFGR